MKIIISLLIALLGLQQSFAQNSTTKIEMVASNWELPEEASFEKYGNRDILLLNGRARVKNQKFTNGTIEVDVYANSKRSFAGITFRSQGDNAEEIYMRLHKSNQADAVQYTPIFNNESNWQLYREHQAMVSFKTKGWNKLRIEVKHKSAEVFVNDEKVMSVDHLKTGNNTGEIGLFSLFNNRFSNFRITDKGTNNKTITFENRPIDPNIITQWEITKAMPYNGEEPSFIELSKEKYRTVTTEKSGLLTISRYLKKASSGNFEQNQEDYTIASTTVYTNNEETRLFSFDYSDKIIVYLNGKPIFKGNNAFRAKGIQYMGHIDINANKLYLQLEKGANKLHCVVIDKANGWGLIGKLE